MKWLVHITEEVDQDFQHVLDPARYVVVVGVPSRVLQYVRGVPDPVEDVNVGLATPAI